MAASASTGGGAAGARIAAAVREGASFGAKGLLHSSIGYTGSGCWQASPEETNSRRPTQLMWRAEVRLRASAVGNETKRGVCSAACWPVRWLEP